MGLHTTAHGPNPPGEAILFSPPMHFVNNKKEYF